MSRYARAFAAPRQGPLFMPYLTAGFPSLADTAPLLEALVRGGAGALEIGVPFSDPLADGPTIQRASAAALRGGAALPAILPCVADLRARGIEVPITLMGYLNPMLAYGGGGESRDDGLPRLAVDAAAAGVDGMIIVDLPPEESDPARATLRAAGLDLIYLLAPTSTDARIRAVAQRASGFVYLVSVTGVTGARNALPPDLIAFVRRVRRRLALPLALGFGISTPAQVATVGEVCDAAVVGSAVITAVEQAAPGQRVTALQRFAEEMTGRGKGDPDP